MLLLGHAWGFLGLEAAIPPLRAATELEIESVRVGFGSGNVFRIGSWTPVWIQLRGGSERFSGFLDCVVPDDDGVATSYRLAVELGPRQSERYTAYARPGGRGTEFVIRLLDSEGRRLAEVPEARTMPVPPTSLMPDEMLILTLGQPMGVDQIALLPGFAGRGAGGPGMGARVLVTRIDPQAGQIPGRWYGFESANAIVIDTNDRQVLQALDALRGQALVDWVQHGGHLVIAVGDNWQAVRDSVLGPILPGLPVGRERVSSLEALDTFAGSNKPITPPGRSGWMVTKLEEVELRGGKVLSAVASLPLVVRGPQGFGRVTLITLGVDQSLFADWPDRGLFWSRALDLGSEPGTTAAPGSESGRFYRSGVTDLASQLRIALEQFPGVRLIPFGWVAFLILLYVLMIGPGDYFFLKKVVKRMELTWITFPTVVLSVSLLAYAAAYRFKGDDLLVNKVDVVDVDQGARRHRGWSILSLFSPQNRDYTMGVIPVPLTEDGEIPAVASRGAADPLVRRPAGTEVITSWFGIPEAQFGGMAGSNRRFTFGGGGYLYQPAGGIEWLSGVRIPIWSTKTLMARWYGPAEPIVDAELAPVGTDRLAGTIRNLQEYSLEDAILAYGKQVYLLGTIAPGATIRVELTNDRTLSGHLKSKLPNYLSDQPWDRDFKINRADLMLAVMFHDSESNRTTEQALSNVTLRDLDLTGQLALDRPMLVARIHRPGSQLAFLSTPSPPKVDQTTLLRVILPLRRATGTRRSLAGPGSPAHDLIGRSPNNLRMSDSVRPEPHQGASR